MALRVLVVVALVVFALGIGGCRGTSGGDEEVVMEIEIEPGPARFSGGRVAVRDIELSKGDFLRLELIQDGVDVAIRLFDGAETELKRADSPYSAHGPDDLLFVAEEAGTYRIRVAGPEGADGVVHFGAIEHRPAGDRERQWVRADDRFREGRRLTYGQDLEGRKRAPAILADALATFRDLGLRRREAEALDALAIALERIDGDSDRVVTYAGLAAAIFDELGEPRRRATALDRVAVQHLQRNRPAAAAETLEKVLPLYETHGMAAAESHARARLAVALLDLGRVAESLDHFAVARERSASLPADARSTVLLLAGRAFLNLRQPAQALRDYREACTLDTGRHGDRLLCLEGQVAALAELGRLDEAGAVAERLSVLLPEDGATPPSLPELNAVVTLGQLERRRERLEAARAGFERALVGAEAAGSEQHRAVALLELGHLATLEGRAERGLPSLEAATDLFLSLGDGLGLASTHARTGQALAALGRPAEALERLDRALAEIEGVRGATGRRDVRLQFYGARQEYYDLAIGLRLREGRVAEALALDDRRRARELRQSLERRPASVAPHLLEEEAELEAALLDLAGAEPEDPRLVGALARLHALRGRIERSRSAEGPAATEGGPPSTGARQVESQVVPAAFDADAFRRTHLDAGTAALVFTTGERGGHLWLLQRDRPLAVHPLPPREELRRRAEAFRRAVEQQGSLETVRRSGEELFAVVLGPVWEELGLGGVSRLAVVPDGPLLSVPFAALPTPAAEEAAGGWLVESHEVVALPSLASLAALRENERQRPRPPRAVALFADPVFTAADDRLGDRRGAAAAESAATRAVLRATGDRLGIDLFQRLPGSGREAAAIRDLVPTSQAFVAVGFAARRETLLSLPASDFRILHLATHALPDPDVPELSRLVFSRFDPAGRAQEGFLHAYEIARLDLPVELVCLSACQTGVGRVVPGEGVLALARAFQEAGASRVVASLWDVSDAETADLMTRLYGGFLHRDLSPAAALREAQRELVARPQTSHPYYWAGFLLHGDWRRPTHRQDRPSEDEQR